jgi:hypothetical protein
VGQGNWDKATSFIPLTFIPLPSALVPFVPSCGHIHLGRRNRLFAARRTSFSQRSLGKSVYYYPEKFSFLAQIFAAKERKDHKDKSFCLCALCVLLRPSSLVAASAALCNPSFPDSMMPIHLYSPSRN